LGNEKITTLRDFVLAEMLRRGMSQRTFAEFVDVNPSTINRMVRNHDNPEPSIDTLAKLSSKCEIDVRVLVALVVPGEVIETDIETLLLAEMIKRLPPVHREIMMRVVAATIAQYEENIKDEVGTTLG
jgi:transcriptional regulator with XRE-family HTH domain